MSQKNKLLTKKLRSPVLILLGLLMSVQFASAQTIEGWDQAVNLSKSGSTSNPILVPNSDSSVLAFWKNSADGYYFSENRNSEWDRPVRGDFPFATRAYTPELPPDAPTPLYDPAITADNQQALHAFWINENEILEYSRYREGLIWERLAWTVPARLDTLAAEAVAYTTNDNEIHLAYVKKGRGADAGIYHRFSTNGGETWSNPIQIYSSSFFGQATLDSADMQFFENGQDLLFVWNDAFTEQVFLSTFQPASSIPDSSGSWATAQIIDSRKQVDSPNVDGPQNIKGVVLGGEIHVFWVSGHGDDKCSLFTRRSADSGESWTFPTTLVEQTDVCVDNYNIENDSSRLILHTFAPNKSEVRYFEEDSWSKPLNQEELLGFVDPVNFRQITASCAHQFEIVNGELVSLVCGSGATDDIWSTAILLDDLVFPERLPSEWTESTQIVVDDKMIFTPEIVADPEGELHAFWVQNGQGYSDKPTVQERGDGVYYSNGLGPNWSTPVAILTTDGGNENPSAAYFPQSRNLMVVWEDSINQQLLFSKVASQSAVNWQDWSDPISIPAPFPNPSYPELTVGAGGKLIVTYVVPYNEGQGLYLVVSEDQGDTWTEPVSLLSIEGAWDILLEPKVVSTAENEIHVAFINQVGAAESARNELYYIFADLASLSAGEVETTVPYLIQNQLLQSNNILSFEIEKDERNNVVHLIWQEWNESQPNLWGQTFRQNGENISDPVQISGFGFPVGNLSTAHDSRNGLHLSQMYLETEDGDEELSTYSWFYDITSESWEVDGSTMLPTVSFSEQNTQMAFGINADNNQSVLFSGYIVEEGRPEQGLFFVSKDVELLPPEGAVAQTTAPSTADADAETAVEESAEVVEAEEEELLPEPRTLTEEQKVEDTQNAFSLFASSNQSMSSALLAFILTGLILALVGGYYAINFIRNQF